MMRRLGPNKRLYRSGYPPISGCYPNSSPSRMKILSSTRLPLPPRPYPCKAHSTTSFSLPPSSHLSYHSQQPLRSGRHQPKSLLCSRFPQSIGSQVQRPQQVTRSTWGTPASYTGEPPSKHRRRWHNAADVAADGAGWISVADRKRGLEGVLWV